MSSKFLIPNKIQNLISFKIENCSLNAVKDIFKAGLVIIMEFFFPGAPFF